MLRPRELNLIGLAICLFTGGNLFAAWHQAKEGLIHQSTQYRPVDYFYIYECFAPIQVWGYERRNLSA